MRRSRRSAPRTPGRCVLVRPSAAAEPERGTLVVPADTLQLGWRASRAPRPLAHARRGVAPLRSPCWTTASPARSARCGRGATARDPRPRAVAARWTSPTRSSALRARRHHAADGDHAGRRREDAQRHPGRASARRFEHRHRRARRPHRARGSASCSPQTACARRGASRVPTRAPASPSSGRRWRRLEHRRLRSRVAARTGGVGEVSQRQRSRLSQAPARVGPGSPCFRGRCPAASGARSSPIC